MEINAICDDIPNIHGIRYIPPTNYADVIYLPNYEEAMQVNFGALVKDDTYYICVSYRL